MTLMRQVIRQFNEEIETRLKILLETPKPVKPKLSGSTIFSTGSTLPIALISTTAAEVLHFDRIEAHGLIGKATA
jgi:hypothetical protein